MFENKTQDSPPERGRSPGVSSSTNESACLFCPSQLLSSSRLSPALCPLPVTTQHSSPNVNKQHSVRVWSCNTCSDSLFGFLCTYSTIPLLTRFLCLAGTESPRPLSKVRTSFVAIEKDGRIGLQQRDPSEASASSISGRKLSGDTTTTEAASSVQLDNSITNISSITPSKPEPVREVAALASSDAPPKGLAESPQIKENPSGRKSDFGSLARKSQGAGDQAPEASKAAPAPVVPAQVAAAPAAATSVGANKTNGVKAAETPSKPTPAASAGDNAKKMNGVKAEQTPKKNTPAAPSEPAGAPSAAEPAGTGRPGRPAPTQAAVVPAPSKEVSKQALKSPEPAPQPKPVAKPTNPTSHPPTTPKAAKPNTEKKAAPPSGPSPGGFVKPRPKSPTRPVKLPASLTTHTTASGSRSRTSGSAPPSSHENLNRSASRSKALGRSSSAAGRQRPSIGPPPKQPAKDHPVVKKDAKVDEGFLARMMRPTQSSASKKNDKVPVTPPRRPAAAPKKTASAKSGTTKRPVSKTTSATTSAAPSPERTKKESSADRDIASVIERISVAEDVQETPQTPEREATIMEELEEEKPGVAPEASNEPEVEEAAAPLANGKTEEPASQPAATGAQAIEETW